MTDLSHIFGGAYTPTHKHIDAPEVQLHQAMLVAGLIPPEQLHLDGKLHRFNSGTKGERGHDKSGWYICFGDGVPAGRFGCWRMGVESSFRADIGRSFTAAEEMAHTRRMAEAKALRDAEQERKHQTTAETVEQIWSSCMGAHPDHPYLKRKNIEPHGARVTGDGRLVVPLFDKDQLATLQYIDQDGGKLYHAGGATHGNFWQIGESSPGTLYIAEGFATAATIHQITQRPVIVAYSASNLVPVTQEMRKSNALLDLVVVADNDQSGVGQKYAEQACAKFGARFVMPPILGDANDYVQAGHDLLALLTPPTNDWLIAADEFCAQPSPIRWHIKNWVQDNALIMVHGPSGGGKTFVVLDWVLSIASSTTLWFNNKVTPSTIVYLAGEGHQGMKSRIAAWKQHHQVKSLNAYISKDGCDLNTAEGYQRVVEQIRTLPTRPSIIVVDTLHRFLKGDENSAQDVKTMLDACSALMREFGCTIILVHHTGVSEEAQHRARGSSAWRGALDIEVSVIPATKTNPMQIVQRKSKDTELAEPLFAELKQIRLPNWLDEEGQAITSAVLVQSVQSQKDTSTPKLSAHRKQFENAWWFSKAEVLDNSPFISQTNLIEYLVDKLGIKESSAKAYVQPSQTGKLIADLLLSEVVEAASKDGAVGWVVVDQMMVDVMLLRKNER